MATVLVVAHSEDSPRASRDAWSEWGHWSEWSKPSPDQQFGTASLEAKRGTGSMPWFNTAYDCSSGDDIERHPNPGQSDGVEFRCRDGWCLAAKGHCNGYPECFDGSDETECETSHSNVPAHGPRAISFEDTDPKKGWMAGPVRFMAANSETDIDYYEVYAELSDGILKTLGRVTATGAEKYVLNVAIPASTEAVVAVSGNSKGQTAPASAGGSARGSMTDWVEAATTSGHFRLSEDAVRKAYFSSLPSIQSGRYLLLSPMFLGASFGLLGLGFLMLVARTCRRVQLVRYTGMVEDSFVESIKQRESPSTT